jgi:hypothetical protein
MPLGLRRLISSFCLIAISILNGACGFSGHGPDTWLDRPLDGMSFDLEPIILQAHASDVEGVSAIQFFINGELETESPAGGRNLEEAIYQWQPPSPGIYAVSAVGIDSRGSSGSTATAIISVGVAGAAPAVVEPILPAEDLITHSPTPSRTATVTRVPTTTLTKMVTPTPTDTRLPPTPTNTSLPPTPTKTRRPPTQTPSATATTDRTAPIITSFLFDPADYMIGGSPSGCDNRRVGISTIVALDPSGIWSIWADWVMGGQSGTVYYSSSDGETWTGVFGPFDGQGTLMFNGRVNDNFGNYAPFSNTIEVKGCIG